MKRARVSIKDQKDMKEGRAYDSIANKIDASPSQESLLLDNKESISADNLKLELANMRSHRKIYEANLVSTQKKLIKSELIASMCEAKVHALRDEVESLGRANDSLLAEIREIRFSKSELSLQIEEYSFREEFLLRQLAKYRRILNASSDGANEIAALFTDKLIEFKSGGNLSADKRVGPIDGLGEVGAEAGVMSGPSANIGDAGKFHDVVKSISEPRTEKTLEALYLLTAHLETYCDQLEVMPPSRSQIQTSDSDDCETSEGLSTLMHAPAKDSPKGIRLGSFEHLYNMTKNLEDKYERVGDGKQHRVSKAIVNAGDISPSINSAVMNDASGGKLIHIRNGLSEAQLTQVFRMIKSMGRLPEKFPVNFFEFSSYKKMGTGKLYLSSPFIRLVDLVDGDTNYSALVISCDAKYMYLRFNKSIDATSMRDASGGEPLEKFDEEITFFYNSPNLNSYRRQLEVVSESHIFVTRGNVDGFSQLKPTQLFFKGCNGPSEGFKYICLLADECTEQDLIDCCALSKVLGRRFLALRGADGNGLSETIKKGGELLDAAELLSSSHISNYSMPDQSTLDENEFNNYIYNLWLKVESRELNSVYTVAMPLAFFD